MKYAQDQTIAGGEIHIERAAIGIDALNWVSARLRRAPSANICDRSSTGRDFLTHPQKRDSSHRAVPKSTSAMRPLVLYHSVAAYNVTGVSAEDFVATVRLANSTITANANASEGNVDGYGDNHIDRNVGNQTAPPGIARNDA
jgi:hypothetical protein